MFNKNKKNTDQNNYEQLIFQNFNNVKNCSNFIDFQSFLNQVLIVANLSENDENVQKMLQKSQEAIANKNEIAFKLFVLSFIKDTRFSETILVPEILKETNSRLITVNFKDSKSVKEDLFIRIYNQTLEELIIKNNKWIEFLPNLIINYDNVLDKYTILFSQEVLK
ncbi:MSC_0623 family F1-like ATPase-associated protein [Mycoplasmopsis gallinarum]